MSRVRTFQLPKIIGTAGAGLAVVTACEMTQYLGELPPELQSTDAGLDAGADPVAVWRWAYPEVTANTLTGGSIHGTRWIIGTHGTAIRMDPTGPVHAFPTGNAAGYTSIWPASPSDIWLAGQRGNATEIVRFDGERWASGFSLADHAVVGLWGSSTSDIWALSSVYTVHYAGVAWDVVGAESNRMLRDIWGAATNDIWAVGDGGTICHYDGNRWDRAIGGPDPVTAPTLDYSSVWGRSASDVWAAFDDESKGETGFSHFDGQSWSIAYSVVSPCRGALPPERPIPRGKRMVGNATHIVAITKLGCTWIHDGSSWRLDDAPAHVIDGQDNRLGVVGDATGPPWIVGRGGRVIELDPAALAATGPRTAWKSPFSSARPQLSQLTVRADGTPIALADSDIAEFTGGQWRTLTTTHDVTAFALEASGDLTWSRKIGSAPTASTIERAGQPPVAIPDHAVHAIHIAESGDGWLVGDGGLVMRRANAADWARVSTPTAADLRAVSVDRDGHAWISGAFDAGGLEPEIQILYVDGNSARVAWQGGRAGAHASIWIAGPDDVWFSGLPLMRFHAGAWKRVDLGTDAPVTAIGGRKPDGLWIATTGTLFALRGGVAERVFDLDPALTSIHATSASQGWAVGAEGATLELTTPPGAIGR